QRGPVRTSWKSAKGSRPTSRRSSAWKLRGNTNEPSTPVGTGLSKPLTITPFRVSGGYVAGTVSTATRRPAADNRVQSAGVRRWLPLTKRTRSVPGTRSTKSSIPCRPGLTPVTSDVHAGKVAGGSVERSGPQAPRVISRSRVGRWPAAAHGATRSSVAPSRPITRSCAPTAGASVDVAERAQPVLRDAVDVGLRAGTRMRPRLQVGAPERGPQLFEERRLARDQAVLLAGAGRQVGHAL